MAHGLGKPMPRLVDSLSSRKSGLGFARALLAPWEWQTPLINSLPVIPTLAEQVSQRTEPAMDHLMLGCGRTPNISGPLADIGLVALPPTQTIGERLRAALIAATGMSVVLVPSPSRMVLAMVDSVCFPPRVPAAGA